MHIAFFNLLKPQFLQATKEAFAQDAFAQDAFAQDALTISEDEGLLSSALWSAFLIRFEQTTTLDAENRFHTIMESLQPILLRHINPEQGSSTLIPNIHTWTEQCSSLCLQTFETTRAGYAAHAHATPCLGSASRRVYEFVRKTLKVPFLVTANIRTPCSEVEGEMSVEGECGYNTGSMTVGSYIGSLYDALRDGRFYGMVVECLREVQTEVNGNMDGV